MRNFIFTILLGLAISVRVHAQAINCRVDTFSFKDGSSSAPLVVVSDNTMVLDYKQHRFEIEIDMVKRVIFFRIEEIGGMIRASGISPMPNANGPFLLKYLNRTNTEVHTLKCLNPNG